MPLSMDVHTLGGEVAATDVATAHMADLQTQDDDDVRYLRYWVDEHKGKVFCLVEAPSADAAATVHRQAHGLVGPMRRPWTCCGCLAADSTAPRFC
jgi:hypothetical protein